MLHSKRTRNSIKSLQSPSASRRTITRQQSSRIIVDTLSLIRHAELHEARLITASRVKEEGTDARKSRYIEMRQNGGEERDQKRAEMNQSIQSYWLALETTKGENETTSRIAWDWTKIFLGIFKLNYLLRLSEKGETGSRNDQLSNDTVAILAQKSLGHHIQTDGEGLSVIEDPPNSVRGTGEVKCEPRGDGLSFETVELEALAAAISQVSPQNDWKSAVQAFVALHSNLVESYRDANWRKSRSGARMTTRGSLQEQVNKEISRVERAFESAERRRDFAIVDLVFERYHMKKELEKRRARAGGVA